MGVDQIRIQSLMYRVRVSLVLPVHVLQKHPERNIYFVKKRVLASLYPLASSVSRTSIALPQCIAPSLLPCGVPACANDMEEGGIPAARIVQEQEQPSPDMFRRLCVQFSVIVAAQRRF
jgi:hypothetical protein